MDWRHRSACLDEDPELFFPIGNTGPAILQIEEAKVVCRRCDVRELCLQWALESGQDHGVWGGLSEDERRTLSAAMLGHVFVLPDVHVSVNPVLFGARGSLRPDPF